MITIVSKESMENSSFSMDNIKSWGLAAAATVSGMIVSHVAMKAMKKQDSLALNGGLVVAGIGGAIYFKNPWVKLIFLGAAGYGLIRVANIAVKEIAAPGNSGAAGLSGFISESIKSKIRGFLPSLGNTDPTLLGDEDLNGMPNLDDVGSIEDIGYLDVTNQNAVGNTLL